MSTYARVTAGPAHIALSKEAAKEGMVLLKNEKGLLPLPKGAKVALFGKATFDYVKGGGGSGDVMVPYLHNLYDGFLQASGAAAIFPDTVQFYREIVQAGYDAGSEPGLIAEPELPRTLLVKARDFTDTAVVSISRFSGESWDRRSAFDASKEHKGVKSEFLRGLDELFEDGDFYFSHAERRMLEQVSAAFPKTVVVLNVGGVIESRWLKENENIGGVLLAWQSGMEGGGATAELLLGMGNPSGKLADTLADTLEDYPGADSFYASDDYVNYEEDIYVGYRYFETIPGAAEKVVYPFGYGLSYTEFTLSEQCVRWTDSEVIASVHVQNTGSVPGKEVVQLYFSAPQGKLGKPAKVLAGYRKTDLLAPGASEIVTIRFLIRQMASYDDLGKVQKAAWVLEKGAYRFYIGSSVRDAVVMDTTWILEADQIVAQLTTKMAPTQLEKRMLADGSFELLQQGTPNDPNANALERMAENDMATRRPVARPLSPPARSEAVGAQLADVAEGRMTLDAFIATLPNEELFHLVGGQPSVGLANTGGFGNRAAYGIPNIMTADGPAGIRFTKETGVTATAFPCATLLACTWNPSVCEAVGRAGAAEAKENGFGVWLTPGVGIHRNPLCGRNFEYYSEDPLLTGKQAAAMVRGIQSQGVAAVPKHFALNNKETNRKNSDSRASERAIREIYLKQFEIIVKEAEPWALMSSYNIINGHRASENRDLLIGILREEWGYQGLVTSDWHTYGEHYKEVMAGNDVKMPAGYPERLAAALEEGVLNRAALVTAVKHLLTLLLKTN